MKQGKFILILFVIVMLLSACTPTPTIEKVKVTFIGLDGSEISNKEVGKGTTITPPTLESTEEYLFHGWSLNKDGKELFDSSTPITSDTTLYSVWLKIYKDTENNLIYQENIDGSLTVKGVLNPLVSHPWGCRIPDEYEGKTIKTIEDGAFSGCYFLLGIEIPSTITHIGECIFDSCYNLSTIIVAEGNKNYKITKDNRRRQHTCCARDQKKSKDAPLPLRATAHPRAGVKPLAADPASGKLLLGIVQDDVVEAGHIAHIHKTVAVDIGIGPAGSAQYHVDEGRNIAHVDNAVLVDIARQCTLAKGDLLGCAPLRHGAIGVDSLHPVEEGAVLDEACHVVKRVGDACDGAHGTVASLHNCLERRARGRRRGIAGIHHCLLEHNALLGSRAFNLDHVACRGLSSEHSSVVGIAGA